MASLFQVACALAAISACAAGPRPPKAGAVPKYPPRPPTCALTVVHQSAPDIAQSAPDIAAWDDLGPCEVICHVNIPQTECMQRFRAEACRMGADILYDVPKRPLRPREEAIAFRGRAAHSRAITARSSSPAPTTAATPATATTATAAPPSSLVAAIPDDGGTSPPETPRFENGGGMWMPEQMPEQAQTLRALGLAIDPTSLSNPLAFPLGAVVSLGGCSASFVSADGLIITNHHCATAALQYNSTPAQNLLHDGYLAMARAEEKWNGPVARVYVTQAFRDVSDDVRRGLDRIGTDRARYALIEDRTKQIVARCEQGRRDMRCSVASFFGGSRFILVEQLEIKDVRLAYAPHAGIGNFGGEVDNWRWPRHAGDFAFFRAYVGPDGKPADHAETNVPYHPVQHLTLASKPLKEGDFVMLAGYPGQTNRLRTGGEVEQVVSWSYPRAIERLQEYIATLDRVGKNDATVALKAAPLWRGLNNTLTKTKGMLDGLVHGGLLEARRKSDADLETWIDADAGRKAKLGDLFARFRALDMERVNFREHDAAFGEILQFTRLLGAASTIVRLAEERAKPDEARDPAYQERNWQRIEQAQVALQKTYDRVLDHALLQLAVRRALRLAARDRPETVALLLGRGPANDAAIDKAIDKLYGGTQLENEARRVELVRAATTTGLRKSRDPLIQLALRLRPIQKAMEERDKRQEGLLALLRPRYIEALRAFSPGPLAPDANGTLRLTYGTVGGYHPSPDAPLSRAFTVLPEVLSKSTGTDPFDAPPALVLAAKQQRLSPYADPVLKDVPVDFLSDLDITGGNSGSPTLNDRAELVGLAFDGNIEAVASDWLFVPKRTRTIHVDLRYILWVMDTVDRADNLLREMGVRPINISQPAAVGP